MATEQDTGKFRKNTKDQYYTKESVAKRCVEKIRSVVPAADPYQWIEPSAGNGVFLKQLPAEFDAVGIDVEPKGPGILKGDFLSWSPTSEKRRIFFGNPPFGRQSCLAKSFIKHAAQYADLIAFILPRSFVKPSMNRAFPTQFHCVHSEELEKDAFEVNGAKYDVPCVFQIWEKRGEARVVAEPVAEVGFSYVKAGQPFQVALKRAGGLAGKCELGPGVFNPQYHYFLVFEDRYVGRLTEIVGAVNSHTFPSNTVGPRSLSKSEVNEVLNQVLEQF